MPTSVSSIARNNATGGADAPITHVSVHTAVTGGSGANEATGGSPAYARKPVTLNAPGAVGPMGATDQPATPGVSWSAQMTFDVPAGAYLSWGAWDALTGGNYQLGADFSLTFTPTSQATMTFAIGIRTQPGA
jgi:hypothetical protein